MKSQGPRYFLGMGVNGYKWLLLKKDSDPDANLDDLIMHYHLKLLKIP